MKNTRIPILLLSIVFCILQLHSYLPAAKPPDPVKSAGALLNRLLPRHSLRFEFQYIPPENGNDVFEIESRDNKIIIRGNSGVSMASGLNRYLEEFCRCQVSLNSIQLDLPDPLPPVKSKIRITNRFKYRYFLNYCTFSYTMAWWDWRQWERFIDYMALKGINLPLAMTGQEAVWQEVYRELGLTPKQMNGFLAGPAYLPWCWMGNIDGMCGPLPQHWIDRHKILQQKIVARERELGMKPVLQGFTGHVPAAVKDIFPEARLHQTSKWAGMPGTWFLDPQDPLFLKIGKSFIQKQTALFGTDHFYNADCFNEVNPPTDDPSFISGMGKGVYRAMQAADPQATWVFQGWFVHYQADFWKQPQTRALLDAVPGTAMLGLDLWGEQHPVWKKTEAFYGKPWIWNVFCHLGQQVNMGGHLEQMQASLMETLESNESGKLCGIGMMMEGMTYNPVLQDFMLSKSWNPQPVDIDDWVSGYAARRYGTVNPRVREVWRLLAAGPYSRAITKESVICTIPRLDRHPQTWEQAFTCGYKPGDIARACGLLLECADELSHRDSFLFDLTHVTREMLVILAEPMLADITLAYENRDIELFKTKSEIFLQLIRDLDELLGTHNRFLLGQWIAEARKWGVTGQEKNYYEWNARTLITMWEPAKKSLLRDYASKQWNGLMIGFYLPRWQLYLDRLEESLEKQYPFDRRAYFRSLKQLEMDWIRQTDVYPSTPRGSTVDTARRLYKSYLPYYRLERLRINSR